MKRWTGMALLLAGALWGFSGPFEVLQDGPDGTLLRAFPNPKEPIGTLVQVPEGTRISLEIRSPGVPQDLVEVGEPAILRDIRVVPVRVHPSAEVDEVVFFLRYRSGPAPAAFVPRVTGSSAFEALYRSMVVNYKGPPRPPDPGDTDGAEYLVIVPDEGVEALLPLVAWKNQKGVIARLVPLSEAGYTFSAIHNYIQNAYETWDPAPEFVLLAGGPTYIPWTGTDNDYVRVAGGDNLNDLFVGRFPAANLQHLQTMVAKVLAYEQDPDLEDPSWFRRATFVVREDHDPDDTTYWGDVRFAYQLMLSHGFVHIDTFSRDLGNHAGDVIQAVNDGRSFLGYRGQGVGDWWSPFGGIDPNALTNGAKMPVVVSTTCATINPDGPPYMGEEWMQAGTPENPRASVAFFGTTTVRSHVAHIRSAVFRGFFQGLFREGLYRYGVAAEAGRLNLWNRYHDITDYNGFTALGDPEMPMWTATPAPLNVSYPPVLPLGEQEVTIQVHALGASVDRAMVCITGDEVYARGITSDGVVTLSLNLTQLDTLTLTVTGQNLHPFQAQILVISQGPYLVEEAHDLRELEGNGDGYPNPGEEVTFDLVVHNIGADTAHDITLSLHSLDSLVQPVDSVEVLESLFPGDSVRLSSAFSLQVDPRAPRGTPVDLLVQATSAEGDTWRQSLTAGEIVTPIFELVATVFQDPPPAGNGNGEPDPGESGLLTLVLHNQGPGGLNAAEVFLSGDSSFVYISIPSMEIGQVVQGEEDTLPPIPIAFAPTTPRGYQLPFRLVLEGDGGSYPYRDSLNFHLTTVSPTPSDPLGPNPYGYWAFDDTDTLSGRAPAFEWFEIDPSGGGPGVIISEITNADAAVTTLPLPFSFTYYGQVYDSISVCSNGFLAPGHTSYRFGDNQPLPHPGDAPMIAPFWDDLDPSLSGDVYRYYDETNHRYIVEFKDVAHYGMASARETFQVILLDPMYHPTPTGDAPILFLYQQVAQANSATVGIESPDEAQALLYWHNGSHPTQAALLQDGRAILFTTAPPTNFQAPWLTVYNVQVDDSLGNGNGIPEPGETLRLFLSLRNRGGRPAEGVVGVLHSQDGLTRPVDSLVGFGDLPPGGTASNRLHPYRLQVLGGAERYLFGLEVTANGGSYQAYLLFPSTGTPEVAVTETPGSGFPFALLPPVPNPVKNVATLAFTLPKRSPVRLQLYDVSGRRVRILLHRTLPAGLYRYRWNFRELPQGVYLLRLEAGARQKTRRIVIVR